MDILVDIPGYEILEEIGRGGMSTVYRAIQVSLGRQLALKVMVPGLGLDPHFKQRFYREGQIVAQLSHPNIVTVFDIGVAGDRYFIAMEYVAGGSLEERLRERLTLEESVQVIKPIAHALQYAHQRGYVHRDIKPSNILFRDNQFAVLADFGIAKALDGDNSLTKTGMTPGTPNYMSPEQIRGQRLDGRSDLYSLGVVFYQMLTGKRPYEADSAFSVSLKHLIEPIPELPAHYAFLQPIIERMLAKVPDERFHDEDDFLQALDGAIAYHETHPAPTKRKRRKTLPFKAFLTRRARISSKLGQIPSWKWVGGAWVAALVLGLVTFWFWETGPDPKTQRIIDQLLHYAERQIDAGYLTEPAGYNAHETYTNILEIAPRNKQAKAGLKRIANQFEQEARTERQAGQLEQGLALVDEGLAVAPEHPGLLALKQTIQRQVEEKKRQQEIARLLAEATRQLQQDRLIAPEGDNAAATFQAVLKLDTENDQALQGLSRITQRLAQRAQRKREAGELQASLALLEQGLRLEPENTALQSLKAEVALQHAQALRERQIAEWLGIAKNQLAHQHFFEPPGKNAYASYRKVLELDPDNAPAKAGLAAIAGQYAAQAQRAWAQKRLEPAAQAIEAGLKASPQQSPQQAKLLALRSKVDQARAEQKARQRQVAELLAQAQSQLAAAHYVTPEGDNAYATYQQVLAIVPGHPQARAGLDEIVQRLAQQARAAQDTGEYEHSLALIQQGLEIDPDHETLSALKEEVAAQKARAQRQARIDALLARAEAQYQKGHFTQPQGRSASAYYRQVLELDPDNDPARNGLARITHELTQRAREKQQAHQFVESLRFIEEALKITSDDPQLLALRDQVQGTIRHEQQRARRIEQLLSKAEAQLWGLKLTQPEGDNAYETYRQVLDLEPENKQAQTGLKAIAKRYADLAEQRRAAGDLRASLEYIQRGLEVFEHPELLALRKRVNDALANELRAQAIQELLAQAEQQLDKGRLTTPQGDNAHASYQQVLALDPNNAQAEQGLQRIAERFIELARKKQEAKEFEASLDWVEEGLAVSPQHAPLQELKTQLQRALAAEQERQQQIQTLLAQAEQQLEEGRLTTPQDDNAFSSYQQVLALDPNNTPAQKGLQRIAERFTELAQEKQAAEDFEASLALVEQALSVFPEHATLRSLKAQLDQELEEKRRKTQVAKLTKKAEEQFASFRLVAPEGDNARESYQRILELDPENELARAGIARIERIHGQFTGTPEAIERDMQRELGPDQQIKDLLAQANQQLAALRLTTPQGDSAYDSFKRVLEYDADNKAALKGLQQIADRYERLAQRRRQEDNLSGALVLIRRGLDVQPSHPGLKALQTEIKETREGRKLRESEVHLLLAKAEQQFEAGNPTNLPANSVFEALRQALEIDPGNPRARQMLSAIAGRFETSAQDAHKRGYLQKSLSIVEEGVRLFPQEENLLALKKDLTQEARKVESLLVEAEQQLSAGQLIPPGANAYETLNRVLKIDRQNNKALESLQTIPKRCAKKGVTKQQQGNIEKASSIVEECLRLFPQNPQLLALRKELEQPSTSEETKTRVRVYGTF